MNYNSLASETSLKTTTAALNAHNFKTEVVETKADALARIKELIPSGVSVMNGSSTSLSQIGFVDVLKEGKHGWNNLHDAILAETDSDKQALLRMQSVISDYYLGSAHAVTETGELLISSNSGSQLPHLSYTSTNSILVVGTQKIVPTLEDAFKRIQEHVIPLEDKRMQDAYGYGTTLTKTLVMHQMNPALGRTVTLIFVKEELGF